MRAVAAIAMLSACGGSQGRADAALPTACSPSSGSTATLADGYLVGMDATRVFSLTDAAFVAWPRGGGIATRLAAPVPRLLPTTFVVAGRVFYVPAPTGGVNATDLDGTITKQVPLATPNASALRLVANPQGDLLVATESSIEIVAAGASSSQVIITLTGGASVVAMAADSDAVFWIEQAPGMAPVLERFTFATSVSAVLASGGDMTTLFACGGSLYGEAASGSGTIVEQRSASDGSLIASGPDGPAPNLACLGPNLFWSLPWSSQNPTGQGCRFSGGLYRWSAQQTYAIADMGGAPTLIIADDAHVYYTQEDRSYCCIGNNVTSCPPLAPNPRLACYTP